MASYRANFIFNITLLITFLAIWFAPTHSQFAPSRATFYGSPDCYGTPHGACGFGEYGRTINDGYVTGACRLFGNGSGCGSCYQVRCKDSRCSADGAVVVVTDYGEGDRTDFILSPRAYSKLALPGRAEDLFACGVVEVEFKRVPCQYPGYNTLYVKVHEHSRNPHYLAIAVIYVSGINDITAAELWQEDCKEWRPMRRVFGVVFDAENPPPCPIKLRFQVSGATSGVKWVQPLNPIPSDWTAGAYYDTLVQLD